MMEFQALNIFAKATGEGLRKKIDLAMPDAILHMRFNQNPREPVDDEEFLQATYRVGVQVEKKKALKQAKEAMKTMVPTNKDRRRGERQERKNPNNTQKTREVQDREEPRATEKQEGWYWSKGSWPTKEVALKGVPGAEREEYKQSREDCWRCGRNGHKTYECFSFQTRKGTTLPPAPWKASAAIQGKRKGSEEPEDFPAPKQQKVATVETMEVTPTLTQCWEDSDSDF